MKALFMIFIMALAGAVRAELPPVSDLTASVGLTNRIELTWSAVSYAAVYMVYRSTQNTTTTARLLATTNYINQSKIVFTDADAVRYHDTNLYYRIQSRGMFETTGGQWSSCATGNCYQIANPSNCVPESTNGNTFIYSPPVAVTADYDGDKRFDLAIYNPIAGTWTIRLSTMQYREFVLNNFGGTNYVAAAEDYDGDGLADPAIYCITDEGWKIMLSGSSYKTIEIKKE